MEQRQLGKSGLTVSSLGLGTRTWGLDTDPHEAAEMLKGFISAGGNFIQLEGDPGYPEPLAVLGEELASDVSRESLRIALRSGYFPGKPSGTLAGRGQLLDSLDSALRLLGTDHVDVWIASGPLLTVPLEETMSALEVAYRSGRARYVGIGNLGWWSSGAADALAASAGYPLAAWHQEVSLLRPSLLSASARELRRSGMGIIAGAPLGGGVLTGKYRHSTPPDSRAASPRFRPEVEAHLGTDTQGVVEAVSRAAEGLDRSAAQVALAWVRAISGVSTAVIGPRTTRQMEHLLEVASWQLPSALSDVLTEVATKA